MPLGTGLIISLRAARPAQALLRSSMPGRRWTGQSLSLLGAAIRKVEAAAYQTANVIPTPF